MKYYSRPEEDSRSCERRDSHMQIERPRETNSWCLVTPEIMRLCSCPPAFPRYVVPSHQVGFAQFGFLHGSHLYRVFDSH